MRNGSTLLLHINGHSWSRCQVHITLMEKESKKELYYTPEMEVLALKIEAPIATSQLEHIDDDPIEHEL